MARRTSQRSRDVARGIARETMVNMAKAGGFGWLDTAMWGAVVSATEEEFDGAIDEIMDVLMPEEE